MGWWEGRRCVVLSILEKEGTEREVEKRVFMCGRDGEIRSSYAQYGGTVRAISGTGGIDHRKVDDVSGTDVFFPSLSQNSYASI